MNWNRQVRGRRVEDGARAVVLAVLGEVEGNKDGNGVYVANNAVSGCVFFFTQPLITFVSFLLRATGFFGVW
jgi:hypothetical protein